MKIKCTNPATKSIRLSGIDDELVKLNAKGLATVSDQAGRFLTAKFSVIEEVKAQKPRKELVASVEKLPKEGE